MSSLPHGNDPVTLYWMQSLPANNNALATAADGGEEVSTSFAPKNIVLCSDGTGNSGGKGYGTNVWRLYNAIDLHGHVADPRLPRQVTFYDDGVGTEDFKLWKLLGGAFGFGVSRNIRDMYAFLVKTYRPGDNIYIFGFSRGGFTARSLAGLICRCGIADPNLVLSAEREHVLRSDASRFRLLGFIYYCLLFARRPALLNMTQRTDALVRAAFKRYRREHFKNKPLFPSWMRAVLRAIANVCLPGFNAYDQSDVCTDFQHVYAHPNPQIRCVGVWDTVGALGAPSEEVRWLMDQVLRTEFHDQALHPAVLYGYQALSIDDERHTFHPILWEEADRSPETIEQVWFAGAHSNVGGGYPKQGMAHVSLLWMLRKVGPLGLRFHDSALREVEAAANVTDKLYDPRAGFGAYYRYSPRHIGRMAQRFCKGRAKIHASVFQRIASGVQSYAPANLPPEFDVVEEVGVQTGDRWRKHVCALITNESKLHDLQPGMRRMVLTRQCMYYGMLWGSIVLAYGVLSLWLRPVHSAAPLGRFAQSVNAFAAAIVPDSLHGVALPVAGYFGSHPNRLAITLLLIAVIYVARNVLERNTQAPFIEFWSRLRSQLDEPVPQPAAALETLPERESRTG